MGERVGFRVAGVCWGIRVDVGAVSGFGGDVVWMGRVRSTGDAVGRAPGGLLAG